MCMVIFWEQRGLFLFLFLTIKPKPQSLPHLGLLYYEPKPNNTCDAGQEALSLVLKSYPLCAHHHHPLPPHPEDFSVAYVGLGLEKTLPVNVIQDSPRL